MSTRRRAARGFTLIEVLMATLLMTIILGALATVTAQWLPNWNRGMARVQRLEKLALGIERIAADLSVAEMIPAAGPSKKPVFEGNELNVSFVRTAVGPNSRPGLEIVRFSEKADKEGLALVRERTAFTPLAGSTPVQFGDAVVLIRAPFRVSFSYAGRDQVWQPTWRDQLLLPETIRITVRDGNSGAVLAVSTATTVHVNLPPDCARSKNAASCLSSRLEGKDAGEGDQL